MSKLQIRQGVFETNSSSTHSISIYSYNDLKIPESVTVLPGEFGWENDIYNDTASKLSYLWEAIKCEYLGWNYSSESEADDAYLKCKTMLIEALHRIGVKTVEFDEESYAIKNNENWYINSDGYIDHGNELGKDFILPILNSDEILKNYLFNEDSFIETGNDNDSDFYPENDKSFNKVHGGELLFDYYKGN